MVIYGNLVLRVFCIRSGKYPRITNGNRSNRYLVYAEGSIQELVMVIEVMGPVISHFKIMLRA